MPKVHDWHTWATKSAYRMPFLFLTGNRDVACEVCDRVPGGEAVYWVKEGYVIALENGSMVDSVEHATYIAAAMDRILQ